MTFLKIKRFHFRLLNLMPNSLTKTRLFLFSGLIFVCYMIYEHYIINYGEGKHSKIRNLILDMHPRISSNISLDPVTIQSDNIEYLLPTRQKTIPRDAVWQTVPLNKEKFFIYSAYLDTRIESVGPVIRIIATTKSKFPSRVWCRLWYSNSSKTVSAFTYAVTEHETFKYSPSFVLCKLPPDGNIGNYPLSVSVVSDIHAPIANEILIQIPNKTKEFMNDIEVCVKPFSGQYDQGSRIVEFVELYQLLGVKHFTFYNYSVSPKVQCVLDRYKDDNLISVLPWNLDMIFDVEIKTEGIIAAFNDCLYRHMYTSKYIAIVDVDEMIIPRSNLTLIEMMKKIDLLHSEIPEVYYYSFRNAFFCLEWADDELSPFNQNQADTNIIVLRKTYRKGHILSYPNHTKYICNPRQVIEAGHHVVSEFLDEDTYNGLVIAPTEIALLHHYRHCNGLPVNCEGKKKTSLPGNAIFMGCNEMIVVDRSVYSYKDELVKKILNARKRLNESCVITSAN